MAPQWYDDEAGPVVRPYSMTGGRTPTEREAGLDLIALVSAVEPAGPARVFTDPEHVATLELCCAQTLSVAEVSAHLDLPVGVVRVLLGDLLEAGLIRVTRPASEAGRPAAALMREVLAGLRAL